MYVDGVIKLSLMTINDHCAKTFNDNQMTNDNI